MHHPARIIDGSRRGDKRLPGDLTAEDPLAALVRGPTAKEVDFDRFEVEQLDEVVERFLHPPMLARPPRTHPFDASAPAAVMVPVMAHHPLDSDQLLRPGGAVPAELRAHAVAAKGFMPADEGDALYDAAIAASVDCPGLALLEVGSYCGRSTIWLAGAARASATVVFAVDHHRGSEENQSGWEHHDPTVVDERIGRMDTLATFRSTVYDAGVEDSVIAVVGQSSVVAKYWSTPLALLFIDGGHGAEPARRDYQGWTPHIAIGGILAIHDVFPDPGDGGRPPYEQIFLPAMASGRFELRSATGSLRTLRCIA